MNKKIKELSLIELQTISGGSVWGRAIKFLVEALVGDIFANPEGAMDDFNAGRTAVNKQWGK